MCSSVEKCGSRISIVVLTYNRPDRVLEHLSRFKNLKYKNIEFIIVDNCSLQPVSGFVGSEDFVTVVTNNQNLGSVGRNRGMEIATGDIVVTLDDDVFGVSDKDILTILNKFENKDVGAVVFQVIEEITGKIINWCHPKDKHRFAEIEFETNDISEGAVAFRRECLDEVGLYPEYFFISHEGPDLAIRIIGAGRKILYVPDVKVSHVYDMRERPGWRRYYFDARNLLWLILRNYTFTYGLKKLVIGWGSLFVYSVRDGYFRVFIRAVFCSLSGMGRPLRERSVPGAEVFERIKIIESGKLGFFKMVRERLFRRGVKI